MLKVFLGFLVSVVVLLSSAYVPILVSRTYATSANVLLTQIQAGGVGAATQEFIVIYNNSPTAVNITRWCLTNKSNATIICFGESINQEVYLPAYKHAVVMSVPMASTMPAGTITRTYTPTSQSSGSIVGGSDTVSLTDSAGTLIDRESWTTSLSGGMQLERHSSGSPVTYQDTDTSADWSTTTPEILPLDEVATNEAIVDLCLNIDGVQVLVPVGMELNAAGECVLQVITKLDITEVLPNAAGSDDGHEFIELYNPNDDLVQLAGYQLYVGPQFDDTYDFPANLVIEPHNYISFTNSDIPYSLLNSSSRVLVALKNGIVVSEMPAYTDPKDDESWAVIDGVWQYTNVPTPELANLISDGPTIETGAATSALQPCATNQYRSPETNRCRLITSTVGTVTPCKDGQYRSEETNRCRSIAADVKVITPCAEDEMRNPDTNRCRKVIAASEPAACKEGQERNPDTNRCRTLTKMPTADYGVLGAETKSGSNWYVWVAVGGVLLLALAYAVWEWHTEMKVFFGRFALRVLRFARIRK